MCVCVYAWGPSHLEVLVAIEQLVPRILAPEGREVLRAELVELDALHAHRVEREPRGDVLKELRLR